MEGAEFILLPQILAFLSLHLNGYKHNPSFLFYPMNSIHAETNRPKGEEEKRGVQC